MSIKNIYSAENWEKVYSAFSQVNFTSYDFNTIKASLIDYLKLYYSEQFNDLIESSELVLLIESFAYVAEQLSYRLDVLSHENFIPTATRKQSILKLAKLISYQPSRNIAGHGLVKITSISTTEKVLDSQGNNLASSIIIWNDPNNSNWKEQFFLVLNRTLTSQFGNFDSLKQVGDVSIQLYQFNNTSNSLRNGVSSFTVDTGLETFPMELVPVLLDDNGPYEKTPDINAQLSVMYMSDGLGDSSDYTGMLMMARQGVLSRLEYNMVEAIPNRALEISLNNINNTDIFVTEVDISGNIKTIWEKVETLSDQNLTFNVKRNRKKFEVETLENDSIKLHFGDGDFSDMPIGDFYIWVRQSLNSTIVLPPNKLVNQPFGFQYISSVGSPESCAITFSLTATIQNSSPSESIEHIRQSAPATYYAQNRMVNAQDYNTFMLRDQSILRLVSVNRTFAGQPKYINWNDASGQYQNVKLFGDDLTLNYEATINSISSNASSRNLIDDVIEPLLSSTGIINILNHLNATFERSLGAVSIPRNAFIEDNRQIFLDPTTGVRIGQLEKTLIQGAIDQHWYGEPLGRKIINGVSYAIIPDPGLVTRDDSRIWLDTVPRTIDGINPFIPGDIGSKLQPQGKQEQFGLCFNRDIPIIGTNISLEGTIKSRISLNSTTYAKEIFTFEVAGNGQLIFVSSNLRGNLGNGAINAQYSLTYPLAQIDFVMSQSVLETYLAAPGDAIILTLQEISKLSWDNNFVVSKIDYSGQGDGIILDLLIQPILHPGTYEIVFNNASLFTMTGYDEFGYITTNPQQGEIGIAFVESVEKISFAITVGSTPFQANDKFIIYVDKSVNQVSSTNPLVPYYYANTLNLLGRWELINGIELVGNDPHNPINPNTLPFDPTLYKNGVRNPNSWIIWVKAILNPVTRLATGFTVNYRELKLIAQSKNTKFWYNSNEQILDSQTKNRVFDIIRILKSNIRPDGRALGINENYDVVGPITDANGIINTNALEIMPSDFLNLSISGDTIPDNLLQFENFVDASNNTSAYYKYFQLDAAGLKIPGTETTLEQVLVAFSNTSNFQITEVFNNGSFVTKTPDNSGTYWGRQLYNTALDFMWQHFTPFNNLIDPSVSNIHDTYILTQGYYSAISSYLNGVTSYLPAPPSSLELRNSYSTLLESKMLSDTVVLHSGKIKLLFGTLAEPQLRAVFKVVKASTAKLTDERLKAEILSVINTYFSIANWDFGQKFYVTELLGLIHQRLPTDIASVVLVPIYSINSFGSLFVIDCGMDEILQSCAKITDIELVSELNATVLRQS